jgi:iduronate 2-sulfatase
MRTDRYRIVQYEDPGDGPEFELFDHQADPHETRNVAADHPDVVESLRAALVAQRPKWTER